MAITIQNLRIVPYSQKNELKCVWGDTLTLTFTIPHVAGESYVCGIDNDRVVYPPSRPVCAYTNVFTRDGNDITFKLPLNTSKFRSYVSTIRKPMPVWLQVCRVGIDGKCETLVLDDILAIPSVLDATNTVCEGDPLKQLLDGKMDKPAATGTEGQVLTMDADGHYAWDDLPHIPEDPVQSDWDESDSSNLAYIKNKPELAAVATSGSYDDLTDKPHIPVDPVQADYDESDSTALDYIKNKPDLSVYSLVTETGNSISMSIDDDYDLVVSLLDKAGNTLSTQDIDLPIESMIVDASYSAGVLTLTLQNGNTVDVDISDIVSGLVPDSRKVNGHSLDEDVTISYNDLTDKPVIPAAQVQSDWDQSDSQAVDFIKNKPVIPVQEQADWDQSDSQAIDYIKNKPVIPVQEQADWDESDSTSPAYIQNKPAISGGSDDADYLCFTAGQSNSTVRLDKSSTSLADVDLEYSLDKQSWTTYTWSDTTGETITLANAGDKVWFRGDNQTFSTSSSLYYNFVVTALDTNKPGLRVDGNIMSLLDKSCKSVTIPCDYCFYYLFKNQWRIMSAPYLPAVDFGGHKNCYGYMFYACSGLNEVHDFPVFNSFYDCNYLFFAMFSECKSLTRVPKFDLGAANIPNGMCQSMFYKCFNLVDASGFTGGKGGNGQDATYVGTRAFTQMFQDCTSLIIPPTLWYKFLGQQSFSNMFEGCTSLVDAPKLRAITLGTQCCTNMFSGCTSLVNAPKLPATTLASECYNSMFKNCTSLVNAPDLLATTMASECCKEMFQNCTSLVKAPDLPATTLASNCYRGMFAGCTSLVKAPDLPATTLASQCYNVMFEGCTSLKYLNLNNCNISNILYGVTTSGVLVAPDSLDVSGFMPANWTKVDAANEPDYGTTSVVEASSGDTFAVCPGQSETGVITVASSLTLTAPASASTDIAYAEVVLDLQAGATVTAGSNLTLVDTPEAGKRNVCVVRWSGGAAKLYVVLTEDLPA